MSVSLQARHTVVLGTLHEDGTSTSRLWPVTAEMAADLTDRLGPPHAETVASATDMEAAADAMRGVMLADEPL